MMNLQLPVNAMAMKAPRFGFQAWQPSDSMFFQQALMHGDVIVHDVDTQRDFIDPPDAGRGLAVPGATGILGTLKALVDTIRQYIFPQNDFQLLHIQTRDQHTPDDAEFDAWPPHCIENTAGADKVPETVLSQKLRVISNDPNANDLPDADELKEIIRTGTTIDLHKRNLGFAWDREVTGTDPATGKRISINTPRPKALKFLDILKQSGKRVALVYGVATDYCVKYAVEAYKQSGIIPIVVEDAIKGIAPNCNDDPFFDDVLSMPLSQVKAEFAAAKTQLAP